MTKDQGKLDFAQMSDVDFRTTARKMAKHAKTLRDKYDKAKGLSLAAKKLADDANESLVTFTNEESPTPKDDGE